MIDPEKAMRITLQVHLIELDAVIAVSSSTETYPLKERRNYVQGRLDDMTERQRQS
jgi:hypothetical protein